MKNWKDVSQRLKALSRNLAKGTEESHEKSWDKLHMKQDPNAGDPEYEPFCSVSFTKNGANYLWRTSLKVRYYVI
jgi:hypothetical protein